VDSGDNIIDFNAALEKKQKAELMVAVQETRNFVARERQGELLLALHQILNKEREFGLLNEGELIEVAKILFAQTNDGLTIK
tara:strand:- start:245 stop:490 length:246 start_codon:yes stop_codon:yes gene_type:complete